MNMKKLIRRQITHSLKGKMFIAILICFAFVISFTLINNIIAVCIIRQKTNNSVLRTAQQTDRYLSFLFGRAKNIAYVFSVNSNLEKLDNLGIAKTSYYDFYVAIWDLYRSCVHQIDLDGEIHSIYIYIDKIKYFINSQTGIYSYKYIKDTTWLKLALNTDVSQQWISHYYDEDLSKENLISFICRADLLNQSISRPVYISVNFLQRDITSLLKGLKVTANTTFYLINEDDKIMATENSSFLGKSLDELVNFKLDTLKNIGIMRVKIKDKGYYQALYERNDLINGGIVILIPESELLSEQRMVWEIFVVIISLITALFIIFGVKLVIDYVDKPVSKLTYFMKKAEKGDFTEKIEEDRKDEFGYLYSSYNQMVEKIEKLIQELYQEKLIKKEMEVKTLQQQINPHFLYNTLDTINWIAKVHKVNDISKIVISLSTMYRITFNKGKDLIKIGDMLESIKCYLEIQKTRYDHSFDYDIQMDRHIEDYWVLNLIVQTIVENAVIHGIDECDGEGFISIKAFQKSNAVYFTIEDNGCGMSKEKMDLITAVINSENISSESGLKNVQKRLRLKYGNEYGLSIKSKLGEGTKVIIKVPVITEFKQNEMQYEGGSKYD